MLPAPSARASIEIEGLPDEAAQRAMSAALGSPYDVTGAAHLPGGDPTMIRIEGLSDSVAYRADKLRALAEALARCGWNATRMPVAGDLAAVRDVTDFADLPGDVWRVSVRPSDAGRLMAARAGGQVIYDWGGGLLWLLVPEGTDLRAKIAPYQGHATLLARLGRDQGKARRV